VLYARGNLEDALKDYSEAIRLQPEFAIAYYNRALISRQQERPVAAIADFRRYLDLGGAARHGETEKVRGMIRELQEKL
jgi:tetratricopeptide (TPR) repeat protein